MSDLDDEELEATRKLNGVAKKSDIEKDIKRCEQLTKPEHANWIEEIKSKNRCNKLARKNSI